MKYGMDPDMKDGQSGIDVVIYRYADVLLTLAECINRNEGSPTTEAVGLVNRVRKRAGLPELEDAQQLPVKPSMKPSFWSAVMSSISKVFVVKI
ncbi:hypothetical protein KUBF_25140 [Bacteroides finegoldii]|nr:hypothetical protein KUBF_25140 [Bacteroides finegoldii]